MSRKRTPIAGEKPKPMQDRPQCLYCGKHLQPKFRYKYDTREALNPYCKELAGYGVDRRGWFHSYQCALWWAAQAVEMLDRGEIPTLLPMFPERSKK